MNENGDICAQFDANFRELRRSEPRTATSGSSATSVVAASELPPPRPPPMGMRFLMAMSAPRRVPRRLLQRAGGPNHQVFGFGHSWLVRQVRQITPIRRAP